MKAMQALSATARAHMFWGYEKPAEKSQAQVVYFLISFEMFLFPPVYCNLLCATILDIISTSCAFVLSLRHASSPPLF